MLGVVLTACLAAPSMVRGAGGDSPPSARSSSIFKLQVGPGQPAPLKGFMIAGKDRIFHPAQARIEGDKVIVWSEGVRWPVAVRYAWASAPDFSLFTESGLPASPFRTDHW